MVPRPLEVSKEAYVSIRCRPIATHRYPDLTFRNDVHLLFHLLFLSVEPNQLLSVNNSEGGGGGGGKVTLKPPTFSFFLWVMAKTKNINFVGDGLNFAIDQVCSICGIIIGYRFILVFVFTCSHISHEKRVDKSMRGRF